MSDDPVLTARQRLVCVDPGCCMPILPGDAVVMLARGWIHLRCLPVTS